MSAANADIFTYSLLNGELSLRSFPMEANTIVFANTMVATNAAGNAVPASSDPTLRVWGRAVSQANNVPTNNFPYGAAGARPVQVDPSPAFYQNSTGGDAITGANVGETCYAVDNQTVALTSAGSTRPVAGEIIGVDSVGRVGVRFLP